MKSKLYCVHVYPAMIDYESIKADTPDEAIQQVLDREWPYCDENQSIDHTEVMRQCECGYDNDITNKKCEDCGKKL